MRQVRLALGGRHRLHLSAWVACALGLGAAVQLQRHAEELLMMRLPLAHVTAAHMTSGFGVRRLCLHARAVAQAVAAGGLWSS